MRYQTARLSETHSTRQATGAVSPVGSERRVGMMRMNVVVRKQCRSSASFNSRIHHLKLVSDVLRAVNCQRVKREVSTKRSKKKEKGSSFSVYFLSLL